MSKDELANWKKIKDYMEANDCTNNMFYKRAVDICNDKPDPLQPLE
jgi:hypothetical protein